MENNNEDNKILSEITIKLNREMAVEPWRVLWTARNILINSDKIIIRGVGDFCNSIALDLISSLKAFSYKGESFELIDYKTEQTKTKKGDDREAFIYIYEKVRRTL